MNSFRALRRAYRSTGATGPFGDLLAAHDVSMEGYFWRLSDPASGRVVIALVGVNTPRAGAAWATVGIAAEPEGFLETAALPDAGAGGPGISVRVAKRVDATADRLRVSLDAAAIDVAVEEPRRWPRRAFGGSSYFQLVPGLNQYWHPWLLGGRARGTVTLDGERIDVTGWQVYAEKNWGRGGFPDAWWWGQAQGFDDRAAGVAFAGGRIAAGPRIAGRQLATEVTALVVTLPDGRVLRLGNPVTSPVRAEVRAGSWRLRGRAGRVRVDVDGWDDPANAFILPVPLVAERRNAPGDLEHLAGALRVRVRENRAVLWQARTSLAALEIGGRPRAERELAARGGNPRPRQVAASSPRT